MRMKTDADGRLTSFGYFGYDASRRPTTESHDTDATLYFTYDSLGNLTTVQDETGTFTSSYDALNRLTKKVTQAGTVYYAYDKSGLKSDLKDTDLTESTFAYDAAGRLTSVTFLDASPRAAYYLYDASGMATTKVLPNKAGTGYSVCSYYVYDNAGRLSRFENRTPPANAILTYFAYQRNANGAIEQIFHEAGDYTYYVYDPLDRMTVDTRFASGNSMIYGFYYNYDAASNRYFKYDAAGGPDPSNKTTYYAFDPRNVMTKETHST